MIKSRDTKKRKAQHEDIEKKRKALREEDGNFWIHIVSLKTIKCVFCKPSIIVTYSRYYIEARHTDRCEQRTQSLSQLRVF
jgi:hypothetical protein